MDLKNSYDLIKTMETNIQFNNIKNKEEFFLIFQGLCNIAESAFNQFEEQQFNNKNNENLSQISRHVSYLMSITFVIVGMRGGYLEFRDTDLISPFFVEVDGVQYDQKYLYKMNDYFIDRFNRVLDILKEIDPEFYKSYSVVWKNY
ncbi:hypothetical protein HOE22_09765 [Candidatus Woesearchaeota archaeon]|jgi:hypothetical protein|nr:hypothetical protein [Candidatus Woesearchaeota archaeon]MBT3729871.1 hypothetical protein [bacterium]MBT4208615.1 hypothetical protein [Candidatus Woesearchaeota archaeon]MBT4730820.1 hypothetical protein [Candidatus Woesearchaeota archaeon]